MIGFSDTEITVSEDVGTVQVGLQVFQMPLISLEFANNPTAFGSLVSAVAGSAIGILITCSHGPKVYVCNQLMPYIYIIIMSFK